MSKTEPKPRGMTPGQVAALWRCDGAERLRNSDVKQAVCSARQRCGAPKPFDPVEHDNEFLLTA